MRVPIIVTGNDLSTLYAPLLRDGRMDKFLWEPTAEDKAEAVYSMLREGGVTREEARSLVDSFPNQPMDFFGAMHSRSVDDAVREWIADNGGYEGMGRALLQGNATSAAAAAAATRGRRADGDEDGLGLSGGGAAGGGSWGEVVGRDRGDKGGSELGSSSGAGVGACSSSSCRSVGVRGTGGVGPWEIGRPTVHLPGRLTLDTLLSLGRYLEREQEKVARARLVEEYMKGVRGGGVREADAAAAAAAVRLLPSTLSLRFYVTQSLHAANGALHSATGL